MQNFELISESIVWTCFINRTYKTFHQIHKIVKVFSPTSCVDWEIAVLLGMAPLLVISCEFCKKFLEQLFPEVVLHIGVLIKRFSKNMS